MARASPRVVDGAASKQYTVRSPGELHSFRAGAFTFPSAAEITSTPDPCSASCTATGRRSVAPARTTTASAAASPVASKSPGVTKTATANRTGVSRAANDGQRVIDLPQNTDGGEPAGDPPAAGRPGSCPGDSRVCASADRRNGQVAGSTRRGATPARTAMRNQTPESASPDSSRKVAAAAQALAPLGPV